MEAGTILEEYIEKKIKFNEILSRQQIGKWFPRNMSGDSIDRICEVLIKDRQAALDTVNNNIQEEFSKPKEADEGTPSPRKSLAEFIEELEQIKNSAELQNKLLEEEIEEVVLEIADLAKIVEQMAEKEDIPPNYIDSIAVLGHLAE